MFSNHQEDVNMVKNATSKILLVEPAKSVSPVVPPEAGFFRIWHIIGNPKANPPIPPLLPVSRSTFLNWVKEGKAPAAVKLSERTTAWRVEDIRAFISKMGAV
jgi:hypothetical protein